MSFWKNWFKKKKKYYFYSTYDRVEDFDTPRAVVVVSEKKLPARTSGECALFLPRIPLRTKIGTKGRLIIGDPRVTKEKMELVSKSQERLPKAIRNYKARIRNISPWWTFRFPTGELIYLRWYYIAWLKPRSK
ncbi:MAG: hypothetical protein PHT40_04665 [Patescibacteria group bacterium]|nr:hypothetical protein [Patescibacteria group bacterium]